MVTRPHPHPDPKIAEEAPTGAEMTDYDYAMLICYLRLLDAERDGADWREVAKIVLKVEPHKNYVRAKNIYDSRMARARWMSERGYRHLLREAGQEW